MLDSADQIIIDVLEKSGEVPNNNSKYYDKAIFYINNTYLSILSGSNEFDIDLGEAWPWALNPTSKTLVLLPPYETGTVSLTNGSANGSFSAVSAVSMVGRYLKVSDRSEYFRIKTHVAGTADFVLDANYTDDTGTTLGYQAIRLEYDLCSDVLRMVSPFRVYKNQETYFGDGKIYGIDLISIRKYWPLKDLENRVPDRYAEFRETETGLTIVINSSPQEETKVDIDYINKPTALTYSALSVPVIPLSFREVISFAATYYLSTEKGGQDRD